MRSHPMTCRTLTLSCHGMTSPPLTLGPLLLVLSRFFSLSCLSFTFIPLTLVASSHMTINKEVFPRRNCPASPKKLSYTSACTCTTVNGGACMSHPSHTHIAIYPNPHSDSHLRAQGALASAHRSTNEHLIINVCMSAFINIL
jgi:hypothetical protein